MSEPSFVIRDTRLHTQALRLQRPRPAPSSASTPEADRLEFSVPAQKPQIQDTEEEVRKAFEEGYRRGLEEARQDAARTTAQNQENQEAAKHEHESLIAKAKGAHAQAEQLAAELTKKLKLLANLAQQWPQQLQQQLHDTEDDMLELVHEAICKILGERVATPEGLRSQLHACLKAWHGQAPLAVHLHPQDIALLHDDPGAAELLRGAGFSEERERVRWVADSTVTLGGIILRSAEGALDARLETQLQALKTSLMATRAARKQSLEAASETQPS